MAVFLPMELPAKDTVFADTDIIIAQEDGSQEVKKITIDLVNQSLALLKLKDTFSVFEDGKYLKSTSDSVILSNIDWNEIQNTPTTISGYGITDAYTKTEIDSKLEQYTNINSDYTNDKINNFIFADTSANTITITLQAEPNVGDKVTIHDNTGSFSTNNLTVDGNGKNINGNANLVLSTNDSTTRLIFNGTEWRIL